MEIMCAFVRTTRRAPAALSYIYTLPVVPSLAVTQKGIDILLNIKNTLRELLVNQCEMITEQEFEE